MNCAIEVPVIRGGWLIQCIDSVLQQASPNWSLSFLWDQGDALSDRILRAVEALEHPRIRVYRSPGRLGIARARQYLTERSVGELVLPLDDDDVLHPQAVARFVQTATKRPWAGILRARRDFIDDRGAPVLMKDWFAFEPRSYMKGATLDVTNHSHPYAIRRSVLLAGGGWKGFEDYQYAGEDCTCFMEVEENAEIELLDETLYSYRIHGSRTSLQYDRSDANEMWARIADDSIRRRKLRVERVNDSPPFSYRPIARPELSISDIDFVIPFIENNEREIDYTASRPGERAFTFPLAADARFIQELETPVNGLSRLEVAIATNGPLMGRLRLALFEDAAAFSPAIELEESLSFFKAFEFDMVGFRARESGGSFRRMELMFVPDALDCPGELFLHALRGPAGDNALLRMFCHEPGFGRGRLDHCLASITRSGADHRAIHVIEKRQSSSANRNEAFRDTTRPLICFLDDDAELASNETLPGMLKSMREWDAELIGPKLLTPSGRLYSGVPFVNPVTLEASVGGLGHADNGDHDVTLLVPWLPSTVLLVDRAVMHATGGFDESYVGSQHEDVDFTLRARSRGFSCLYEGRVAALHHNSLRNGGFRRNSDYLKTRWRGRPDLFVWPEPRQPRVSG